MYILLMQWGKSKYEYDSFALDFLESENQNNHISKVSWKTLFLIKD